MARGIRAGLMAAVLLGLAGGAVADYICDDGSPAVREDDRGCALPASVARGDADLGDTELSPVPEPGTWLLIGTGMLLIIGYLRRRRIKN